MSNNGVSLPGSSPQPAFADDVSRDNAIPGYVDPSDVPMPGAGPVVAVRRFYQLFSSFHGRASRSEFWWVVVWFAVAYSVLGILAYASGAATGRTVDGELELGVGVAPFTFTATALAVISVLPWISLGVRRLHDLDLSGLVFLVTLVPGIGTLALLALSLRASNPEGARYDRIRVLYPSDLHPEEYIPPAVIPPSEYRLQQQNTASF